MDSQGDPAPIQAPPHAPGVRSDNPACAPRGPLGLHNADLAEGLNQPSAGEYS